MKFNLTDSRHIVIAIVAQDVDKSCPDCGHTFTVEDVSNPLSAHAVITTGTGNDVCATCWIAAGHKVNYIDTRKGTNG